jgi:hypothetical protein
VTATSDDQKPPTDRSALAEEIRQGLERSWPVLAMVGFLAYFDWTLNGQIIVTFLLAAVAYAPSLFARRLAPHFAQLRKSVPWPPAVQRIVAVGVPLIVMYLTRWRGTQPIGPAIVTVAAPLGLALAVATQRKTLGPRLAPFYEARNRVLPRGARFALVFVVAILSTFIFAHGSLTDLGAFFGGQTTTPRAVGDSNVGIVLSGVVSGIGAFLLLDEPKAEASP